jgi:NADH-quinone oxidoreductase subunit L
MPLTFATYAVGMMALCGVPLVFSGFWSKDAILAAASHWSVSSVPFYLGVIGAFLTAFYMTRQVFYVFFGTQRNETSKPHESPVVMTIPLAVLAVLAVVVGFFGTPAWPWFDAYLDGERASLDLGKLLSGGELHVMIISTVVIAHAMALAAWIYHKVAKNANRDIDPLEKAQPAVFSFLQNKMFVDELFEATVIRLNAVFSNFSDWLDRVIWSGLIRGLSNLALLIARFSRGVDESVVNRGFDAGCEDVRDGGKLLALAQDGQVQSYLRVIGIAVCALLLLLLWGCA